MTLTLPTKVEIEQFVRLIAPKFGLQPDLVLRQVAAESSFDQRAVSSCGARGLMQLTPICVKDLALRCGLKVDPNDWRENLTGGMAYMSLLQQSRQNYPQALAAYNWGEGHLTALLKYHPLDWRKHLPEETANYLTRIVGPETKEA